MLETFVGKFEELILLWSLQILHSLNQRVCQAMTMINVLPYEWYSDVYLHKQFMGKYCLQTNAVKSEPLHTCKHLCLAEKRTMFVRHQPSKSALNTFRGTHVFCLSANKAKFDEHNIGHFFGIVTSKMWRVLIFWHIPMIMKMPKLECYFSLFESGQQQD